MRDQIPRGSSWRVAAGAGVCLWAWLAFSGCAWSPEAKEARYLDAGKRQMQKRDYARAIIQFYNATKVMPKDAEPCYQLALAYLARREYPPAYYYLKKAVELNPQHQQAQLKLAELMAATSRKEYVEQAQRKV